MVLSAAKVATVVIANARKCLVSEKCSHCESPNSIYEVRCLKASSVGEAGRTSINTRWWAYIIYDDAARQHSRRSPEGDISRSVRHWKAVELVNVVASSGRGGSEPVSDREKQHSYMASGLDFSILRRLGAKKIACNGAERTFSKECGSHRRYGSPLLAMSMVGAFSPPRE